MDAEASKWTRVAGRSSGFGEGPRRPGHRARSKATALAGAFGALALVADASLVGSAWAQAPAAPEVVVYASELPAAALSEFDFWNDAAAPGGRMAGTPNHGADLDPPPENDPHVAFKVKVQAGIPYRFWVHMKVGKPKGVSQANMFFVQFSDAVDKDNKPVLKPGSPDYLTLRGPQQEGWTWVGGDAASPKAAPRLVYFRASGEVTVRMQAGMEGVGFDQVVLSPARYLDKAPAEAVVAKAK
jgi:hypothetical protein